MSTFSVRYGFTEKAFNFQSNNFGRGGRGNDRVTVSVQDKSGLDNANFATPPDGQSGHMRMYLWDFTVVRIIFFPWFPQGTNSVAAGTRWRTRKFNCGAREHPWNHKSQRFPLFEDIRL